MQKHCRILNVVLERKTLDSVLNEIKNMEKEYYLAQHNYKIYYSEKDQRYRTYVKNDDEKRKPLNIDNPRRA